MRQLPKYHKTNFQLLRYLKGHGHQRLMVPLKNQGEQLQEEVSKLILRQAGCRGQLVEPPPPGK